MVRITGGAWRGRRLDVPAGIRPTTELARKAAFDILGDAIRGARVLDACAGSGAYGLEALSRGAAHATFVEADRKVAEVLRGNVERLATERTFRIEVTSARGFSSKGEEGRGRGEGRSAPVRGALQPLLPSKKSPGPFPREGAALYDIVFHDPPFEESSAESDLSLLIPLVRPGGWLFHERGDDLVLTPGGVPPADRRRYGLTRLLIYRP